MADLRIAKLAYQSDCLSCFEAIEDLPGAVLLDSGHPSQPSGRYDILTASPYRCIRTRGAKTYIQTGTLTHSSDDNPFNLLRQFLSEDREAIGKVATDLPFFGGAVGYIGYDLARRFIKMPSKAKADILLPDMMLNFYAWALIIDHDMQLTTLVATALCDDSLWSELHRRFHSQQPLMPKATTISPFKCNMTELAYHQKFNKIQEYLHAGESYQINFARRFSAQCQGASWTAYRRLRKANPAPYSAYLKDTDGDVLSLSPELFLESSGKFIESQPIKGTIGRDIHHPILDQHHAQTLMSSIKDRAENTMIVDLMRNDLSRSCTFGSVDVESLCQLKTFPAVHHLVSKVCGHLRPDIDATGCLELAFPAGSVTGAPKLRTMQLIEALEPHRRNLYCGSIGYVNFHGDLCLNVAIRTLIWAQNHLYCYAGGGITVRSDVDQEYAETMHKVGLLLSTLNRQTPT